MNNITLYTMIGGGIIIILLIWIFIREIRKKNKKIKEIGQNPNNIPQEVLEDFNKAEQQLAESKGEKSPHQILFDLSDKRNGTSMYKEQIEFQQDIQQKRPVRRI